jgi:long-chain fatty acid transport protein
MAIFETFVKRGAHLTLSFFLSSGRHVASAVAVVVIPLFVTPAHAAGIAVARFGGEHGTPTTGDPTAIYYNPAGLAFTKGTNVYVEGLIALRSLTYNRAAGAIDNVLTPGETGPGTPQGLGVQANSGEASLFNPVISPFIGVASNLGVENLGVAVGFYTPFGGTSVWKDNEQFRGNTQFPGAVDGQQRWHNIEGTIRSSYITAAGAYQIPSAKLSFGLGLNVVLSQISTVRARNVDGTDHLVSASGSVQEGRSFLDVKSTGFSIGAGVIYEPTPELRIGLSYQSQPNFGDMKLTGTIDNKLATAPATQGDAEVVQQMPDVIRLGVQYQASEQLQLRFWGDFTRWSVFDKQCIMDAAIEGRSCEIDEDGAVVAGSSGIIANIPRYWKNTFGLRASGSWNFTKDLELNGGFGYDGNAVPDKTMESSLPDMTKLTVSVGSRIGLLDGAMDIVLGFTQVIYLSRSLDPMAPLEAPSTVPDGAGEYKQWVSVFTVGVGYRF